MGRKMCLDTTRVVLTENDKRREVIKTLLFCLDLIKCLSCDECSCLCSGECETQQRINAVGLLIERLENDKRSLTIKKGEKMTRKSKERLKPCPFCGGEKNVDDEGDINTKGEFVECTHCGASGPRHYADNKEAIKAWNGRGL